MDSSVVSGHRGWATQVDLQIAGALKSTDGQNKLALGYTAAFGISEKWSFYLPLNVVNTWDKKFTHFSRTGISVSPRKLFSSNSWWRGAQVQIVPVYKYFVTGDLKDDGDGTLEINVGGEFAPTIMWDITGQKNYKVELTSLRRGIDTGVKNDWNVFINVTTYFGRM